MVLVFLIICALFHCYCLCLKYSLHSLAEALSPFILPAVLPQALSQERCVSADCSTYTFVGPLLVRKELVEVLCDITRDIINFTVA